MERHLLLTMGDDLSSLHAVRFVGSFFKDKTKTRLTLLYIASKSESTSRDDIEQKKRDARLIDAAHEKGKAALDAGRKLLRTLGFRDDTISTEIMDRRFGTVKDIVYAANTGLYDAVVLGRRGYALFEKAFATSVSREIMEHRIHFPLWFCRLPEEGRKNVLLCVDDTEPSLRIADHVGFILAGEEDHTVTIFHVDEGEGKNIEMILRAAKEKLVDNKVEEERIKIKVVRGSKTIKAIHEETDRGAYAAVAVGRGGAASAGTFKKWLMGSRSMKLLEELEKAALWVSK